MFPLIISAVEYASIAFALIGAILAARLREQRQADKLRQTYELFFPSTMGHEQVLAFIRSLSGLPKPKFLKPVYGVSFERYADDKGERYFLHTPGKIAARLDELFYEHIDGSMEPIKPEDDPVARTVWVKATELAMSGGQAGLNMPLRIMSVDGTAKSMGAQFKNMAAGEAVVLQWVIFPDRARAATADDKDKVADHTFHAMARLGAVGEKPDGMLHDLYSVFASTHSHGAHFAKRLMPEVPARINRRAGTWGFPIFLNAQEFSALMGWPLNGTGARRAKRIAPTAAHDTEGIILGTANSPKMHDRRIAMPPEAGDMHIKIMGGSGTGKSNLLLNLGVQWLDRADTAFILLEPAGDLAWDLLKRVPEHRVKDVIWFDPLDTEYPIGLNPLRGTDPERITGHIVGILKNLSGDSWSAQLQRVSTNAVMTAALNRLTFYDIKQLLVNKEFRAAQVKKINRAAYPDVLQEWRWLDDKHDLVIDSTVNRLDAFLGSRMIRNIVSQQDGLDFDRIIREHKILLVPLPAARMGQTNASAIGSLVREMAWNAAMKQPMDKRQRSVVMLDEFQNFADFSTSRSDPFSEARKYKQQYIIANQYTEQLPDAVRYTVDKNVATQMVFRLAPEDARKVKERYAPLSEEDLSNLPRFNVAARIMSSSGLAPTVTLKTAPPPPVTPYWDSIIANTRAQWAKPRAEVEANILTRHKSAEPRKRAVIGALEDES